MDVTTAAAVAWLAQQIRDDALKWSKDRLAATISPKIDAIAQGLSALDQHALDAEERADDALVAPLREGIAWWRTGSIDKAVEKLMEAFGRNSHAPLAHLAVAFAHIARGPVETPQAASAVAEWVATAIRLNPYILVQWLEHHAAAVETVPPPPEANRIDLDVKACEIDLSSSEWVADAAKRFKWPSISRFAQADLFVPPRSTAAILRASLCGRNLAVEWVLASSFHRKADKIISLFALDSGTMTWARMNSGEELEFLSYSHAVVRRADGRYALLDLATGDPQTKMSRRYFDTMFGRVTLTTGQFTRANCRGVGPEAAYKNSAVFHAATVPPGSPDFHMPKSFDENWVLAEPLGLHAGTVRLSNRWRHEHYNASVNLVPTCRLVGGATISLRSGEPA